MERICNICKIIKPFSEFNFVKEYNIPFSRCKSCYNKKCKQYRQENKEVYRKWVTSKKGKQVRKKAIAKWRAINAIKRKAHTAVSNALRDRKLIRLPCEICNDPISEGHHTSYEKENWLKVKWLCKKHHTEITYSGFRSK